MTSKSAELGRAVITAVEDTAAIAACFAADDASSRKRTRTRPGV